ncbi:MAG: NACHT domain-containing protein [Cyanobacteria bacterium J06638_20]
MSKIVVPWLWLLTAPSTVEPEPSKLDQILEFMNGNPYLGWGIATFAVLAMATAAIANWTGNLGKIIEFVKKYLLPSQSQVTDEQQRNLLKQLNKVVLDEVTTRREKSLHYRIQMDLRWQLQMRRVGRPDVSPSPQSAATRLVQREFNPFTSDAPPEPIDDTLPTRTLFEHPDINGRLLILGEPGAGKTTELLALAQDLLQHAQQSEGQPIPVIFELSAWSNEANQTLADWLVAQLKENYDISPEVAQPWIETNQILPLLDGLDELRRVDESDGTDAEEIDRERQAQQVQCLRDINTYLTTHPGASMVVCCRRKEYEALEQQGEKLRDLHGAIYLQSLSDEQIATYFQQLERPHQWTELKDQPDLLDLARSPLFLLMLVVVYQGQTIQNKEQLLDDYIEKQLTDLNNQGAYPPHSKAPTVQKTERYLGWLAVKLRKNETTEFLIERLQPSWLDRKGDRLLYRWIGGLLFGLLCGLLLWLSAGLLFGLLLGLLLGLIFGLFGGLRFGLKDITPAEKLKFSWKESIRGGLLFGLSAGLIFGLLFGLSAGLFVGLSFWLSAGLDVAELQIREKQYPNQGIRRSLKSAMLSGLIGGLIGGLGGLIGGLLFGLSFGLLFGLIGGLSFGLGVVIQHSVLRILLFRSGCSPWNYERFLEHAENHRFIQRVGGRYRFVHDLLRTRFAERYVVQQGNVKSLEVPQTSKVPPG